MSPRISAIAVLCACTLFAAPSHAALFDRGGGLIYDDVLDVTWLADANRPKTMGYVTSVGRTDGGMWWPEATAWVADFSYYDAVRDVTYADWRLPSALNPDGTLCYKQYNCTLSELGHMFYNNLGGTARVALRDSHNGNWLLFSNIVNARYWTSTPAVSNPAMHWFFRFSSGDQGYDLGPDSFYIWPVRDGDVLVATPLPPAVWLFASGVIGLIGVGRGVAGRLRRPELPAALLSRVSFLPSAGRR